MTRWIAVISRAHARIANFSPFRKDVTFDTSFEGRPIHDVIGLELTDNPHWGMLARCGFFEISAHDANLLRARGLDPHGLGC